MARLKTEPFAWRSSRGLLQQAMLREYVRWLFPQLGRAYEPPMGVKDFTAASVSRFSGRQPQPFRPRASTGPVLRQDLQRFADYCFEALKPYSDQAPYRLGLRCALCFMPDLKRLHQHLVMLIAKKRLAESKS
jgi:hypothetical protein